MVNLNDITSGSGEASPIVDFFIAARFRNKWVLDATEKMTRIEAMATDYTDKDKQQLNMRIRNARDAVMLVVNETADILLESCPPTSNPINHVKAIRKLLRTPIDDGYPIMNLVDKWLEYKQLLVKHDIIPKKIDIPNAYDRMLR